MLPLTMCTHFVFNVLIFGCLISHCNCLSFFCYLVGKISAHVINKWAQNHVYLVLCLCVVCMTCSIVALVLRMLLIWMQARIIWVKPKALTKTSTSYQCEYFALALNKTISFMLLSLMWTLLFIFDNITFCCVRCHHFFKSRKHKFLFS